MNALEKYAAKKKLAQLLKEAGIPNWAKPFVQMDGDVLKVIKWPKSEALKARVKMLKAGRDTAPLFRPRGTNKSWRQLAEGGPVWKHRKGKPDAGWPKGGFMDRQRTLAGRK